MKLHALLPILVLASGCAFTPQQAEIAPTPYIGRSHDGDGTSVTVEVKDERSDTVLGYRGNPGFKGARDHEKKVEFVQGDDQNTQIINAATSEVLTQFFQDEDRRASFDSMSDPTYTITRGHSQQAARLAAWGDQDPANWRRRQD